MSATISVKLLDDHGLELLIRKLNFFEKSLRTDGFMETSIHREIALHLARARREMKRRDARKLPKGTTKKRGKK